MTESPSERASRGEKRLGFVTGFLEGTGRTLRFDKRWFFLVYVLAGLPYLLFTGPFRAPDERNHFLRAYEISEGRLNSARVSGAVVGDDLPASLSRLSGVLGNHAEHHIEPGQLEAARALRLEPKERGFIEFSTAVYSPLAYLPGAVAIALGRLLRVGPLALLYFARSANLLAGSALIAIALSRAGYARRVMLLVMILPMTVSQVATVTADAISYGIGFLWIALVLETAIVASRRLLPGRLIALAALGLALSQLRPPYPLLGLLVVLIPATSFGRKTVLLAIVIVVVSVLPSVAWNRAATRLLEQAPINETVQPVTQARWVAKHPGIFWHRAKQDVKIRGAEYWEQFVGRLGWLNIELPAWIPIGFAVAFALGIFIGPRDPPKPPWWHRLVVGFVAVAGVLAIQFMLYLTFNPVGSPFILGVQGRYFAPLAVLAAYAFANSLLTRPRLELMYKLGLLLFAIGAHCAAVIALLRVSGRL